jgi:hypothetical protein
VRYFPPDQIIKLPASDEHGRSTDASQEKLEFVVGRMTFRRPALNANAVASFPNRSANKRPVIGKVMPFRLLFDRHAFYRRVGTSKCPKLFSVVGPSI